MLTAWFDSFFRLLFAIILGGAAGGDAFVFSPSYDEARKSAYRLRSLIYRISEIDPFDTSGEQPEKCFGRVEYNNVKFSYLNRKDITILSNFSTVVEPGKTLALVGLNGSGKSTCLQLLERFYDPDQGIITLDQNNIKKLKLPWLRSQLGIVPQNAYLFDMSVGNNIRYGDNSRKIPMEEVINVAKMANIHEFILALPKGYATNVGPYGVELSGGQIQRIALARALIRNPKVLLIDEATCAIDEKDVKAVQQAFENARDGRTCIFIAHRLSSILKADSIAVIHHGQIVESGTNQKLLELRGVYYNLFHRQI